MDIAYYWNWLLFNDHRLLCPTWIEIYVNGQCIRAAISVSISSKCMLYEFARIVRNMKGKEASYIYLGFCARSQHVARVSGNGSRNGPTEFAPPSTSISHSSLAGLLNNTTLYVANANGDNSKGDLCFVGS